ncbi:MAG: hypothetical protein EBT08_11860 [Betaproteobacteria bacterium]|nr:hypothetical protein [Betaproteobacteria bacterium]
MVRGVIRHPGWGLRNLTPGQLSWNEAGRDLLLLLASVRLAAGSPQACIGRVLGSPQTCI